MEAARCGRCSPANLLPRADQLQLWKSNSGQISRNSDHLELKEEHQRIYYFVESSDLCRAAFAAQAAQEIQELLLPFIHSLLSKQHTASQRSSGWWIHSAKRMLEHALCAGFSLTSCTNTTKGSNFTAAAAKLPLWWTHTASSCRGLPARQRISSC